MISASKRWIAAAFLCGLVTGLHGCTNPWCRLGTIAEWQDIQRNADGSVTVFLENIEPKFHAADPKVVTKSDRIDLYIRRSDTRRGKYLPFREYTVKNPDNLPIFLCDGEERKLLYPGNSDDRALSGFGSK